MKIKDLIENSEVGAATTFDVVAAIDGGKKLIVEQRQLLPEAPRHPIRASSPARAHTFATAASLAAYLVRYGGDNTVVFADAAEEKITAILDERAEKGFERLVMDPETHPLWMPWREAVSRRMRIADLALLIRTNRRSVSGGAALAALLSQVNADVKVERRSGQGKSAINGLVVTTKIQGTEQGMPIDLPDTIFIVTPLYVGTAIRTIELDLLIDADRDGNVYATLTPGNLAEERVAAFEEMCAAVEKGFGKGVFVYGTDATTEWKHLPEQVRVAK